MAYAAPLADFRHALAHILGARRLAETEMFADATPELVDQVLEEAGKFAAGVLEPLNRSGDETGARRGEDGSVTTPEGFAEAYRQFVEGGWNGVNSNPEWGGMGLPTVVATAIQEMLNSANMSFALCPLLTQGAVHALEAHGSDELKATYLEKLVSGQWTGTMNLTEPQAGSDVGALRARAEPQGDGTYRIFGTKIFITYGEHDMAENIVHLVLARLPDAPIGTRGISLFATPKFIPDADGSPGARNDVKCLKLEEKLGIHGSPTCVLEFGEAEGAVGWLIGAENQGMACMFTMMNDARLAVGVQGVAMAEAAFQHALAYAQERRQGKPFGKQHEQKEMAPIIEHADVRRMLMTMKAMAAASRAVCLDTALQIDLSKAAADEGARMAARGRAELLTPIAKAWSTDLGCEAASLGVQVHGGMGFIEETGAAQYLRDARIAPIYEGTNGIQAIDLATRKLPLGNGEVVRAYIGEIAELADELGRVNDARFGDAFAAMAEALASAAAALSETTEWMLEALKRDPQDALAGATPYLRQFGVVAGGAYLARGALAGARDGGDAGPHVELARFFAENLTPEAGALARSAKAGARGLYALDLARLAP